jgi:N-acetylglutamate synthase-like GNAT family acetyltransferase
MLIIRRAEQEDRRSIAEVHTGAVRAIRPGYYTPEEIEAWAVPHEPERYAESIRSKEFYVAVEDDAIVGFGVLNQERSEIEALYVGPKAARRGTGLKILRRLEESARESGLETLRLNASLNAVQFYESAGYAALEESTFRLATGVSIACVPMMKSLTPGTDAV